MTPSKFWSWAVALGALAAGCGGTSDKPRAGTETDNPVTDEPEPPPPYESPIEWNPNDPGVPGCPPPNDDTYPERGPYAALTGNDLVVEVDAPLGLYTVDVSDPSAPQRRGSLPLGGYGVAAVEQDVAVLTEEWPDVPTDELPSPEALDASTLRLVHVDVSDPDDPKRLGHVDLEGEPWRTFERDGVVWSMRATLAEQEPSCAFWQTCNFPTRIELLVDGYRFTPEGFEQVESITLPMRQRAWAGHDGFVTATSMWDGDEDKPTGMYAAHFEGDALMVSEFEGELGPAFQTPVGVEGALLYFFTGTDSFTLHVMDISGPVMVPLSELPGLPQPRAQSVHFSAGRVIVSAVEPTASGIVVDLTDPSAPSASPLPAGVAMALPLDATRLLGWGDPGTGTWSVGVVQDGVFGQVASTDFPSTSFPQEIDPFYVPGMVLAGDRVAFPAREYDDLGVHRTLVSIDATTDPVAVEQTDAHAEAVFAGQTGWVAADSLGVSTRAFDGAAGRVDFDYQETTDVTVVGNRVASLAFGLGGVSQVVISKRDGTELGRVDVPATATRLFSVDDRVVVMLGEEGSSYEQSTDPDSAERGFVVVDPVQATVVGRADFPALSIDVPSDRVSIGAYVRTPVQLLSGEWVTAVDRGITCSYVADCEALGIEARSFADAGIVPGTLAPCPENEPCPEPPAPPEVYGTRSELALYRLEVSGAGKLRLSELGSSVLELQDSSFGDLLPGDGEVLVTRRERQRQPGEPYNGGVARFMLERFAIDGSTTPEPVNVPGYAAGVSDDGSVFTIEPGSDASTAATLHRLRITDQGAYVQASRSFEGRYGGVRLSGDHAYYLAKGADGCALGRLQPIVLDDDLTLLEPVDLPGSEWTIVEGSKDALLLGGPSYAGVALFDTSDGGASLLGYFRASPEYTHLFDGEVWTAAYQHGVQHFAP